MSFLSFLVCPTWHTILPVDIHSDVRRQLCPQIVKLLSNSLLEAPWATKVTWKNAAESLSGYSYNFSRDMTFLTSLSTKAGISLFGKKHRFHSSYLFRSLSVMYLLFSSLWLWHFFFCYPRGNEKPMLNFSRYGKSQNALYKMHSRRSVSTLGFTCDLVSDLWNIPNVPVHIWVSVCACVCNICSNTFSCYQWINPPGS